MRGTESPSRKEVKMIVHVNLPQETARRLTERAAREGQTLEVFLRRLAEYEAGTDGGSPTPEDEEDEGRPWRGVLALDYPREELFRTEREVDVNQLPDLPPTFVLDPRRLIDDDE
jgi:hypothetical protein